MNSIEEKLDQPECSSPKKRRTDEHKPNDAEINNKRNFFKACEHVSQNAYLNYKDRLQVLFLPKCSNQNNCKHVSKKKLQTINDKILQIPPTVINSIQIEISDNMWSEAVEISFLSITPKQYLTANALKEIVGIMLNAHEDISSEYSVAHLITKCEQTLALHFRMHPPCFEHENIMNVYRTFLFGKSTETIKCEHSQRELYEWDKGIVQYCLNRLEYEISLESQDGPLIDVDDIIPDEFKDGTRRLHYQKEQLEIYEVLERTDRIERLMAVLRSTMELLQFNLFIIKSRSESRKKALIVELFWQEETKNQQRINKITEILKQIMRLFAYFVHLNYPEEHVQTMSIWLNMAIETVYYSDIYCHFDYPTLGKLGADFADEFYKIIVDLPHKSIVKVLKRIRPSYMTYTVGLKYIKEQFNIQSKDENIIKILISFLKNSLWNDLQKNEADKNFLKKICKAKVKQKNIIHHLSEICKNVTYNKNGTDIIYPKLDLHSGTDNEMSQNICISALYIILDAYLNAYNIQKLHIILEKMNNCKNLGSINFEKSHQHQVTERLVSTYKKIYQFLQELIVVLDKLKNENKLPEDLHVFENIIKLELLNK